MPGTLLTVFFVATCSLALADANLEILKPGSLAAANPTLSVASRGNVIIYRETGCYGGLPANHGRRQWYE
ncbi:MAG: hypothetical protein K1X78_13330 [Verrucomicrobiaceae bacterium]|nr:hypothetical protein [Verrucomicrobiaceae bacterium]